MKELIGCLNSDREHSLKNENWMYQERMGRTVAGLTETRKEDRIQGTREGRPLPRVWMFIQNKREGTWYEGIAASK